MLKNPSHPYTELLLDSVARIGEKWGEVVRMPDLETKDRPCRLQVRRPLPLYVQDIYRQVEAHGSEWTANNVKHESLCFKLVDYQNVQSQPEPVA